MNKKEFKELRIGNYVQITQHGQNKGKIGWVMDIIRGPLYGGSVRLLPYNCEFQFTNKSNRRQKEGLTAFNHASVRYLGKSPNSPQKSTKIFYVATMYGKDGIEWPTSNFTDEELKVINRFLKELNDHASTATIDAIVIMDDE